MKKFLCVGVYILLLFWVNPLLNAQSNTVIDELLGEEQATLGNSAYLIFVAAGLLPEEATIEEAVSFLRDQEWSKKVKGDAGDPVKLGQFSLMLMKSLDIRGGLGYGMFKGPKYACRELVYLKIIVQKKDPYDYISGQDALMVLSRALDWKEENL
jgi:hypothetical protein